MAGKAIVTCATDKVTLVINKCVVPDVAAEKIHLKDAGCFAVAEGESDWKIESASIAGCGAVSSFDKDNNLIVLSNSLFIGNIEVDGVKFGRSAELGYECKFNSQASASSKYSARKGFH